MIEAIRTIFANWRIQSKAHKLGWKSLGRFLWMEKTDPAYGRTLRHTIRLRRLSEGKKAFEKEKK